MQKRKNYFAIVLAFLCLALPAPAADLITVVIQTTNGTVSGNSVTLQGSLRYATNAISGSTWVTNASPAQSSTNLLQNLTLSPISLAWSVQQTNTNTIVIYGAAPLTASISSGWGILTLYTNAGTNHHALMVPYKSVPTTTRTNDYSDVLEALGTVPTNTMPPAAPAFAAFINSTTVQSATNKTFRSVTNIGGLATNVDFRGVTVTYRAGETNGIKFGQHQFIASPSGGANLVQADGEPAEPNDPADIITYYWGNLIYPQFGGINTWQGTNVFNGTNVFAGGFNGTNGRVFNLNVFGLASSNVFQQSVIQSNTVTAGTNRWTGDISWEEATYSSMANTNNTVPAFTNAVVYLSGSTTAHDIAGVAGGRKGLRIRFYDSGTLPLTIRNLGGGASAGNRIRIRTGNDATLTNNPACFELDYNSTASEWDFIPLGN